MFTRVGQGPAITEDDPVEQAPQSEAVFRQTSCLTAACTALRDLAAQPSVLANPHP